MSSTDLKKVISNVFDENMTMVDNFNDAVFYSDKDKFIKELVEAINTENNNE